MSQEGLWFQPCSAPWLHAAPLNPASSFTKERNTECIELLHSVLDVVTKGPECCDSLHEFQLVTHSVSVLVLRHCCTRRCVSHHGERSARNLSITPIPKSVRHIGRATRRCLDFPSARRDCGRMDVVEQRCFAQKSAFHKLRLTTLTY